jgi:hypothetical protein
MLEAWEGGWMFEREVTVQLSGRRCCALGAVIVTGFSDIRPGRPVWEASALLGVTGNEAQAIAGGFDNVKFHIRPQEAPWWELGRRLFEHAVANGWTGGRA